MNVIKSIRKSQIKETNDQTRVSNRLGPISLGSLPFRGNIILTGAGRGVGTSMVSVALAGAFAYAGREVCFTEITDPAQEITLIYDRYDLGRRIKGRVFDYYQAASLGRRLRRPANIQITGSGSIDWRIIKPEDIEASVRLSSDEMARLIASASGEINIFDVNADPNFDTFLCDADVLICVLDPLPSFVIRNRKRINMLRNLGGRASEDGDPNWSYPPVYFVYNKMNRGVSGRRLKRFVREPLSLSIPLISPELIYGAEYRHELPWESEAIFDHFFNFFDDLSDRITFC